MILSQTMPIPLHVFTHKLPALLITPPCLLSLTRFWTHTHLDVSAQNSLNKRSCIHTWAGQTRGKFHWQSHSMTSHAHTTSTMFTEMLVLTHIVHVTRLDDALMGAPPWYFVFKITTKNNLFTECAHLHKRMSIKPFRYLCFLVKYFFPDFLNAGYSAGIYYT